MSSATEHFNKTAESYETATGGATRELGEHAISLMTDVKPLTSESRILDNACGTGHRRRDGHDPPVRHGREHATRDPRRRRRGKDDGRGQAPVPIPRLPLPLAPQQGPRGPSWRARDSVSPTPASPTPSPASGSCSSPTPARARGEIARTLRPDGGVAVVTGWAAMGHVDVHPRGPGAGSATDDAPFKPPFPDAWLDPGHTEAVLVAAGLDVQASTRVDVHVGRETAEGVARLLTRGFGAKAFESWSDDEKGRGRRVDRRDCAGAGRSLYETLGLWRRYQVNGDHLCRA